MSSILKCCEFHPYSARDNFRTMEGLSGEQPMDEPSTTHALGELVRDTRQALALSANALAIQIGCHESTITLLERGKTTQPKPKLLEELSIALGLDLAQLYRLAGYRIPATPLDVAGFLHVRHRGLPEDDIERIANIVEREINKSKRKKK